jgi:UDP-N-acetyl-D-mannosaminuronic acid dehydrogenase
MGLAFKPDIDDLRESPAVQVAQSLRTDSAMELLFVEPNIDEHADFEMTPMRDVLQQADLIVFLVKHREFVDLEGLDQPILDYCGVFT